MRMRFYKQGFSLVELSIVLVILGLLTGGILAGQSLIRASELRSVAADLSRFKTVSHTFRDKYFAIPGDFLHATKFWGDQAAGTSACADAAVPNGTPGTCNGNGDGMITAGGEWYRFWQHLQMGGLIEGSYTGYLGTGGGQHHELGVNSPKSKISNAGWATAYAAAGGAGDSNIYGIINYHNYFILGVGTTNDRPFNVALRPEELWNIDTKLDDGKPAQGIVISGAWDGCTTSANQTDLAGEYALTVSALSCWGAFVRAF